MYTSQRHKETSQYFRRNQQINIQNKSEMQGGKTKLETHIISYYFTRPAPHAPCTRTVLNTNRRREINEPLILPPLCCHPLFFCLPPPSLSLSSVCSHVCFNTAHHIFMSWSERGAVIENQAV